MPRVEIYTRTGCKFCALAKAFLKNNGIEFTEETLDDRNKRRAWFEVMGVNSVPQIFIDEKRIGGYTELLAEWERIALSRAGLTARSLSYKPFAYPWAVELAKKHEKIHWIEDEVDLSEDLLDWKSGRVDEPNKDFIKQILRLFTQAGHQVLLAGLLCFRFLGLFGDTSHQA